MFRGDCALWCYWFIMGYGGGCVRGVFIYAFYGIKRGVVCVDGL
jgi:hypothetical protein